MKKSLAYIKRKLSLLAVVTAATAVGGLSSAAVLAAIPDSNGQVNSCYDNTTMALSVSDDGTCASGSTALNWKQNTGPIAYAHLQFDPVTLEATIDTAHSKNVSSVYSDASNAPGYYCLTVTGTPKNITVAPGFSVDFLNTALKDGSGWSSDTANGPAYFCNEFSSSSNVGFNANVGGPSIADAYLTIY
jgi:hypothetical protein